MMELKVYTSEGGEVFTRIEGLTLGQAEFVLGLIEGVAQTAGLDMENFHAAARDINAPGPALAMVEIPEPAIKAEEVQQRIEELKAEGYPETEAPSLITLDETQLAEDEPTPEQKERADEDFEDASLLAISRQFAKDHDIELVEATEEDAGILADFMGEEEGGDGQETH